MAAPMVKTRTPGVYKRGSRYVFSYRVDGRQRWESARTLDDARQLKARRLADIGRGELQERSRTTLHVYASEWIERYQGQGSHGFRDTTRTNYRDALRLYALAYFPAQLKLTELTPRHVAEFIGWMCDDRAQSDHAYALSVAAAKRNGKDAPKRRHTTKRLSDSTVRNALNPLRACLKTAVREGVIRHSPTTDAALPHRPRPDTGEHSEDVRVLTREQLQTFLDVVHPRHRVFFRLLAATGLRSSELIALRWCDLRLDGSAPVVKVRRAYVRGAFGPPKSRHGKRDVPLDPSLVFELRRLHSESEWSGDGDLAFPSLNGTPLMIENLRRRILKPALEEAGAPWAGFHTFRHTCASMLFQRGSNAVQVQRWLGHHSAAFTLETYVHLLDGDIGTPIDLSAELRSANTVRTDLTGTDWNQMDPLSVEAA